MRDNNKGSYLKAVIVFNWMCNNELTPKIQISKIGFFQIKIIAVESRLTATRRIQNRDQLEENIKLLQNTGPSFYTLPLPCHFLD